MQAIHAESIGEAWLESCKAIFEQGKQMNDGDQELRELLNFSLTVEKPSAKDFILAKYADREMINWMLSNFMEKKRVPELKNALSYGTRLFDYRGKNQIEWVIRKLRDKPESKSATIPLIIPDEDEQYIPCVSLLDFKIRDKKLMLVAVCRSLDFGKKAYANMVALNKIQEHVANQVSCSAGPLFLYVVSAHVYLDDYPTVKNILKEARNV